MISTIRSSAPSSILSIHQAQRAYSKSVERLVARESTSPDQVARSVKVEAQQREVIQRRLNQNQWRSLAQTADAALGEITTALYRIHEIALRGLNTFIGPRERNILHEEAKDLESWVNMNMANAHFNGKPLFDQDLNIHTIDEGYQLQTALNLDPLLQTHVPNDDHEIVLIFDPSRSLSQVDELFDKVVEAAQKYQSQGGDVSIGIAFAPIKLNNRHGQTPGPRDMVYHPPVNITDDHQGEHLDSLKQFLDDYDFAVGPINFGEAIKQVHDETEWRDGASQSMVIITTAGGEDNKTTISDEIERFLAEDPRRRVSAIGVQSGNNTTSTYFDQLIDQLDAGHYEDYSDQLSFDDIVETASGEMRFIPEVNISSALFAEDTMAIIEDALDKVSAARGQLGAIERRAEATIGRHFSEESSLAAGVQRTDQIIFQESLAQRVSSEFRLNHAIKYHQASQNNHWQRFLELVQAHT